MKLNLLNVRPFTVFSTILVMLLAQSLHPITLICLSIAFLFYHLMVFNKDEMLVAYAVIILGCICIPMSALLTQ